MYWLDLFQFFLKDLPNEGESKICKFGKQESRTGRQSVLDDKQIKSSGKTEWQEEWMQSAALRLQQSMAITRNGTTSKTSLEKELGIMVVGKENVLRCHEKGKAVVEPAGDVKWSFCSTPRFKDLSWSSVTSFEQCAEQHVWVRVQGGAVRDIRRHTTDWNNKVCLFWSRLKCQMPERWVGITRPWWMGLKKWSIL